MSNTGLAIRSVLSLPSVYRLFSHMVGSDKARKIYVEQHIKPHRGNSILDIGCGPADILEYLPDVKYIGFDMSAAYIDFAKKRFGTRGTFICEKVSEAAIDEQMSFDIVLATGILHHLDDAEAIDLFKLAFKALKSGGRLVTIDGCYTPTQSRMSRYIISKDRGNHVRTKDAYLKLASTIFPNINDTLYEDMLRIPYTHLFLECTK